MTVSNMAAAIQSNFLSKDFAGVSAADLAFAISKGAIDHAKTKTFTTTDTGTVAGAGVGVGTGITGISAAALTSAIVAGLISRFGQGGPDLLDMADSIAQAFVAELSLASLSSSHSPVWAGTAVIDVGSINFNAAGMASAIEDAGLNLNFEGVNWGDVAEVIGEEFCNAVISSGAGNLVITGSGSAGGAGSGVGTGVML